MGDVMRVKIGKEVARKRKAANLSQKELAEAASLKEVTIRNIEKGAFNVPLDVINRISVALGCEWKLERIRYINNL